MKNWIHSGSTIKGHFVSKNAFLVFLALKWPVQCLGHSALQSIVWIGLDYVSLCFDKQHIPNTYSTNDPVNQN